MENSKSSRAWIATFVFFFFPFELIVIILEYLLKTKYCDKVHTSMTSLNSHNNQ